MITNCIECPWFESCDEIDESYCIDDELNRVKTELNEMEENKMEKELKWTNEDAIKMLKSKMDGSVDTSYEWAETVRLAINALEGKNECKRMTNEQAIEILANARYADDLQGNEELTTAHYMAIEALKTQHKWIPVEERLPEEHECDDGYMEPSEYVLVQLSNGGMKVSRYWGRVIDEPWMDLSYPTTLSVVAWMPLPKPYEKEADA